MGEPTPELRSYASLSNVDMSDNAHRYSRDLAIVHLIFGTY